MTKVKEITLEFLETIVIAASIIIPVRYFLIQPFFVKGQSMEPTFQDGNYLIVDEISYRLRAPERGEVIVFRYPYDTSEFYIKRIIGLPGDRVELVGGRVIVYNQKHPRGLVLGESYMAGESGTPSFGENSFDVGANQYFVLGDNRSASYDSRKWGLLDKKYIVGKALVRVWPFNEADFFTAPSY